MIFEWSTCQCCGQSAKQRLVHYDFPGWPQTAQYPDLCDKCFADITSHFSGNGVYDEIKRRSEEFKRNYVIVGFEPIIRITDAALTYSI